MRKTLLLSLLTLGTPLAWANPDPAARRLPASTQIFASGRMLPPPGQMTELMRRIESNPAVEMLLEELPLQFPDQAVADALSWVEGEVTFAWVRTGERSVVGQFELREKQEAALAELERQLRYLGPEVERFRKKFKRSPDNWQEMVRKKVRQSVPQSPNAEFVLTPEGVTVRYKGELALQEVSDPPRWRFGQGLAELERKPYPPSNLFLALKSCDDARCRQALSRLVQANEKFKELEKDRWTFAFASEAAPLQLRLAGGYLVLSDNPALIDGFMTPAPGGLDQNPRYRFQRSQLPASDGDTTFAFVDLEDLFATTRLGSETLPEAARACKSIAFVYDDTPSTVSILPTAGRAEGLVQIDLPSEVSAMGNVTSDLSFLDEVSVDSQMVYAVNLPAVLTLAQKLEPAGESPGIVAGLWEQFQKDSGVNMTLPEVAASTGWIVMESDVLDDVLSDVKNTFSGYEEEDNLVKWLSRKSGSWTLQVKDPKVQETVSAALWQKTGESSGARGEGPNRYWMRSDGSWTLVSLPQKLLASSKLSRRLLLRTLKTMAEPGSGITRHTSLDEFRSHLRGQLLGFTSQKSDWLYSLVKGLLLLADGQSRPEAEVLGRYRDTYAALSLAPEGLRMYSSFYSETPVRPQPAVLGKPELLQLHKQLVADFKPSPAAQADKQHQRNYGLCQRNLKNIATALEMWASDNAGRYPTSMSQLTPMYLKTIPTCPAAGKDTYSAHYKMRRNPDGFSVYCWGHHHKEAKVPINRPAYNAELGLVPK